MGVPHSQPFPEKVAIPPYRILTSNTFEPTENQLLGNRYNSLNECIAQNQDCANILPKEICCQE